ncbi:MAG: hypothetical protein J5658_14835 [Prevotella sp.]|nr:hypothetical protein [Prevotella sp.]
MFWRCSKLTSLNLTGFDTQKVETMSWMFSGCTSLVGGKYTVYLHLLQVFRQKNAKQGLFLTVIS